MDTRFFQNAQCDYNIFKNILRKNRHLRILFYPLYYQNTLLKKSKLSPYSVLWSMSNGPRPAVAAFMYTFSEEITGRNVPRSGIGFLRIKYMESKF